MTKPGIFTIGLLLGKLTIVFGIILYINTSSYIWVFTAGLFIGIVSGIIIPDLVSKENK